MTSVGVRQLKNQLSRYLRRVKAGERLVVTERGEPVAILSPPTASKPDRRIEAMLRDGLARWEGGKPSGAGHAARLKGRSVAEVVIEDRR
jgi:prevent-host-death family protein